MERKNGNVFSFFLGLVFIIYYTGSIFFIGVDGMSSLFFILGLYNVWKNRYWIVEANGKVKPQKLILIVIFILVCLIGPLYIFKLQVYEDEKPSMVVDEGPVVHNLTVREIIEATNNDLPSGMGNGDSCMMVRIINDTTLEYVYKLQYFSLDKSDIKELTNMYNISLKESLKKMKQKELDFWKNKNMNFIHVFKNRNELDGLWQKVFSIKIKSQDY